MHLNTAVNLGDALRIEGDMNLGARVVLGASTEEIKPVPLLSDELRSAVATSWSAAYTFLFDEPRRPFVANLARHHRSTIKWHWTARHRLCRQQIREQKVEALLADSQLTDTQRVRVLRKWREKQPRYMADFPMWPRGHMKCVDGDTEILMADGTRKLIREITAGEAVQSYDASNGQIVRSRVGAAWQAGLKHCVRVKTRSGRELIATPDHRVLTFEGWKTVGELAVTDRIASPRRTAPGPGVAATDQELRLLAYFIAEGNTTAGKGSFAANITNSDNIIVDDAIACAESLGFKARRSASAKYRVTFTDGIRPWLAANGLAGKKATEKRLPSWLFQADRRQAGVFVAAFIDTDGFVSKHAAGINLANEALVDDLRQLCLQAGFLTKKYYLHREGFGSWVIEFDRDCLALLQALPMLLKGPNVEALLATKRYSLIDCYPKSVTRGLAPGMNRRLRRFGWTAGNSPTVTRRKIRHGLGLYTHRAWEELEAADVFWDAITSIDDIGERMTYDISVPDTQNFIAAGLVTHNSTVARRIAVMDAVITLFYGIQGGYCLYFSGTDKKTEKHAISIDRLLKSPRIREHAPLLSEVKREDEREKDKAGRSLGWKATFFYTAANYIYHFGSLQSGLAGGNVDDIRPTLLVPDDIDDRKDSPVTSENNFNLLTTEILPMGAIGTLTLWAQNLISRYSCMYRIHKGHARVLTNRRPSKPIPAIRNLVTEVRTVDRTVRDVIVSGTPTWKYFGIAECQDEINRMGLPAFLRECQHEVEQSTEGLMIHNYDDAVHVISQGEFESVFGERTMPKHWPKEWGNDWARTKTAKHANVAMWRTVSVQNGPLPGFTFLFYPMSFKANAQPEDVAERVLSCLSEFVDTTRQSERGFTPRPTQGPLERTSWSDLRRDELIRANALAHTQTQLDRIEYERSVLAEVIPQYAEPLLAEHNVVGGVNSHEREDIRLIYNEVYALKCEGVNPGKFGGVEQINRDMAVDYNEPHPFRPAQLGFTRTFIVVPDDTTQRPTTVTTTINGVEREIEVYPPEPYPDDLQPDDLHDDRLIRYQMMNWRLRDSKITETGEQIDDPLKMNDDFGNLWQMFTVVGHLLNTPLSPREEFKMLVESKMPVVKSLVEGQITATFDKAAQQQLEGVKMVAEAQLREKYGEEVFEEEIDDETDNWWE